MERSLEEPRVFSIEKLKVYDKALASVAGLTQLSAQWNRRHAVVDQLVRASESVVLNIAEGVRLRGTANRQHLLDYAIGSALECAGCLDIARLKQFLAPDAVLTEKQTLSAVVKMLVGLRKSWSESSALREEALDYGRQEAWLFAHERLEAYQGSLQFVSWFHALPGAAELSSRLFRQIDRAATSIVLNIAEGNGRPLEGDHRQFLATAEASVVKAATFLDLCQRTAEVDRSQRESGMTLLERVALLVRGLARAVGERKG